MDMHRTQLYLPKDLYAQLEWEARRRSISVSEVVRQKLAKRGKKGAETLLKLVEIGKKYKIKAPKDLSSRLDYYLYGSGSSKFGSKK